ncbi:lipoteichoic acid stability factor AuxA [Staphylococcus sp. 11262D007BW]
MSFFNKYTEVIYSYIIGALSILLSIIIFINIPLINQLNDGKRSIPDIDNAWDFTMAFFHEIIRVMSQYIGDIPLVSGIIILLFGILMIVIGRTLTNTTRFDYDISILFLLVGIIYFVLTLIFMSQVYSWVAFIFIIPFLIHIEYIAYKDELNPNHRKQHYLWIIMSYGISYILTQLSLYGRIEAKEIAAIDVLSINTFFIILWLLGQMAIWNFLFLRRALPMTQEEMTGEANEYSRSKKYQFSDHKKYHIKDLQERTTELTQGFTRKTRRSVDIEKLRNKKDQIKEKWFGWAHLEEEDIPSFLHRPKWLKKNYVILACGIIILFFILLEFNNRNNLFMSGDWQLSQTQYVYEWVSLFLLLIIAILYIVTSVVYMLKGKWYYLQLFMISILFFKLLTEYIVILFNGLLLSIFITPILILMLIPAIIAFIIQLKQPAPEQKEQ